MVKLREFPIDRASRIPSVCVEYLPKNCKLGIAAYRAMIDLRKINEKSYIESCKCQKINVKIIHECLLKSFDKLVLKTFPICIEVQNFITLFKR